MTQSERLASIQALVIYTIMRLTESGVRYFHGRRDMIVAMKVRLSHSLFPSLRDHGQ